MMRRVWIGLVFAVLASAEVPRRDCFPVEDLAPEERAKTEELFLKLMDSEALYTVVGGWKPMSSGFVHFLDDAAALEPKGVDEARRRLERFHCGGEVFATVEQFARPFANSKTKVMERAYEGVVFRRTALGQMLERKRALFGPMGITPHSAPMQALVTVEFQENPVRLRALGFLYGYPDHAVEWFYRAAREQDLTGVFVTRDFVSLPTQGREERGVVYAVPKGHAENDEDRRFRDAITRTLAEYRSRRERYIGQGKPGVVELLRDWFCAGELCSLSAP